MHEDPRLGKWSSPPETEDEEEIASRPKGMMEGNSDRKNTTSGRYGSNKRRRGHIKKGGNGRIESEENRGSRSLFITDGHDYTNWSW